MLTETAKASIIQKVEEIKAILLEDSAPGVIEVTAYGNGEEAPFILVEDTREPHWSPSDCYEGMSNTTWNASNC